LDFSSFGLCSEILKVLEELGFVTPTEIQSESIPRLLEKDQDFVGLAQTGTGKTAAFVLPLLSKIDQLDSSVQAIILAPTRELANQVQEEVERFSKYLPKIKSLAIFGGSSYTRQIRALKKDRPQIVVGTPGRVMDLIDQGHLILDETNQVILDEADEMLNMGFWDDVQTILEAINNEERKIWMFSATMPAPINALIKKEFKDPTVVSVKRQSMSNENIEQKYFVVKNRHRLEALCRFIDTEPEIYGIIFCRTRLETRELGEELLLRKIKIEVLNGDMGQSERDAAMARFKSKNVSLLICTDVAARGIDVNNITHVINYGAPQDFESYVHRIGRTGRAGLKGIAVTFIGAREEGYIRRLEKFTKGTIKREKLPSVDLLKNIYIEKEVSKMETVISKVTEKGEDFFLDSSYEIFKEKLGELDRDEILKTLFTVHYNKKLKRYDDIGDVEDTPKKSPSRDHKNGRGNSSGEFKRGRGKRTQTQAAELGNVRLFVNIGVKDGIKLQCLLGDLSKATGLKKRQIQNVQLKDRFSFLEIPMDYKDSIVKSNSIKIKNKKIRFECAR
jgi:ATP-dependent RNA helicase DeaD